MLRSFLFKAYRLTPPLLASTNCIAKTFYQKANLSCLSKQFLPPPSPSIIALSSVTKLSSLNLLQFPLNVPLQQTTRTVTKFSLNKGKRKTVKAVIKRFKRLDWGMWIRTYCGRHKKLFKKSPALKRKLRQHVFTNAQQSYLLDKMVTSFWRRPKYYVDDPYAPYHKRDEYFVTKTKPFKV